MAADRKRPDGVTLISLWYLVLAAGAAFGACATSLPIGLVSMHPDMAGDGRFIASVLLGLGLTMALVLAIGFALVAWGLWQLKDWGRVGALILALLHLPFFPVGTAIGVGTLWYLSSHEEVREAFGGSGSAGATGAGTGHSGAGGSGGGSPETSA